MRRACHVSDARREERGYFIIGFRHSVYLFPLWIDIYTQTAYRFQFWDTMTFVLALLAGICECNRNTTGKDCSIPVDQSPHITSLPNEGLCDVTVRNCSIIIVYGEYFYDSKELTCHIEEVDVSCLTNELSKYWAHFTKTLSWNGKHTVPFTQYCVTSPIVRKFFDVACTLTCYDI